MRVRLIGAMAGALALGVLGTPVAASATTTTPECAATAHFQNAAHTGSSCASIATVPTKRWQATLNGPASYPLVAGNRIFVTTTTPDQSTPGWLYALNAQTGKVLWGPLPLTGTYHFFPLAYDAGRVFVNDFDGTISAFSAATGRNVWATTTSYFSGEPVAVGGRVWVQGASTVYSLDERTGAITSSTPTDGDGASVAANAYGAYVSTGCQQQSKISSSGAIVWQDSSPCDGGGGGVAVVGSGRFFGSDGDVVANAKTGAIVGSFSGMPAIAGTSLYLGAGENVVKENVHSRVPDWTATVSGNVVGGPIVTSAAVYVATDANKIDILSPNSGALLGSITLAGAVQPGGEYYQTPQGIAIGENLLLASTGALVTAYS